MTLSASETTALITNAARGAGFPPEQSAAFGRAATLYLSEEGDPGVIEAALADHRDSPILRLALLPEHLVRAARLAGPDVVLTLEPADAALATSYARLLPVRLEALGIVVEEDRRTPQLSVTITLSDPVPPARAGRVTLPPQTRTMLTDLAERLKVPESDGSRAAGAGAGDIDNA